MLGGCLFVVRSNRKNRFIDIPVRWLLLNQIGNANWFNARKQNVANLTVIGSLGAFATFAWLIAHWPVTRISFISVIVPVVALVLGMVFLHERPGAMSLIGACVILGAVITGIVGDHQADERSAAAERR